MLYYNFREDPYFYEMAIPELGGEHFDERNGIICVDPSFNFECYINYIELLNSLRHKWVNFGYLDMGMVPLWYAPSFMHKGYLDEVVKLADNFNIRYYVMPSTSVLKRSYKDTEDLWVFRKDAAELLNKEPNSISSTDLIRRFLGNEFT